MPEEALDEINEPASGEYEKVIDGHHIDTIYPGDNLVGVGGLLSFSWWAEDVKPIDLTKLDALKGAVDSFLDEYNVPGERALYLVADFS